MRRPLCAAGAVYLAVLFILQLIFPIAIPIIKVGCDDHASGAAGVNRVGRQAHQSALYRARPGDLVSRSDPPAGRAVPDLEGE